MHETLSISTDLSLKGYIYIYRCDGKHREDSGVTYIVSLFTIRHIYIDIVPIQSRAATLVWWQNGDLGLGWVLEYIQRFIVDSGRWDPTDHKSD